MTESQRDDNRHLLYSFLFALAAQRNLQLCWVKSRFSDPNHWLNGRFATEHYTRSSDLSTL